jgi:serine/threonine-protein kinase
MGEVYRGFNIQTMDPVAIKMIRPEFSNNKEIFELFRREASILHNLTHESIVRYFVFSVDPDLRRAYLAMEFVEGPSLTDRFPTGPLELGDVQNLRRRIASALEVAHQHGVVHRDISPDNIILPQNDVRSAKLIDFGIARSLYRVEVSIIGGRFAGKYNFASPEQFGLAGGEIGPKSDIYSFGLVLAAALRGRPIDMSGSEVEAIAKRIVSPDLSDVDPTMRPLLQAMLQPAPANRPASMAEVATWEPGPSQALRTASARSRGARPLTAPPTREGGGGRKAALLGAAIALASVGGAAQVFRDELARWAQSVISHGPPTGSERPQAPGTQKQPEIPTLRPEQPSPASPPQAQQKENNLAPAPSGSPVQKALSGSTQATDRESEMGTGSRPPVGGTDLSKRPGANQSSPGPTADELADALPPRPPPNLGLPGATVGAPYRAKLPPFSDPGGKGLRLAADGLPEGIDFNDLGDGMGAIEGVPTRAGDASIRIVATNHNAQTAQMTATVAIADRPQSGPPEQTNPAPPAPPRPPGSAPSVPPAVNSPPQPGSPPRDGQALQITTQSPGSPTEKARHFVAAFNGGDCFLIKHLGESGGRESYLGFGRDVAPFQRFDTEYKSEVGAEADIRGGLIQREQCAALDLIRLGGAEPAAGPRLELQNGDVGRGKPLTGKIANLAGRRPYLIRIDSHGFAHRLDVKNQPGGDAATFDIALVPDGGPAGSNQVLLAVVSDAPIAVLENLRHAPLQSIAGSLVEEARRASASVEADYFKFVD